MNVGWTFMLVEEKQYQERINGMAMFESNGSAFDPMPRTSSLPFNQHDVTSEPIRFFPPNVEGHHKPPSIGLLDSVSKSLGDAVQDIKNIMNGIGGVIKGIADRIRENPESIERALYYVLLSSNLECKRSLLSNPRARSLLVATHGEGLIQSNELMCGIRKSTPLPGSSATIKHPHKTEQTKPQNKKVLADKPHEQDHDPPSEESPRPSNIPTKEQLEKYKRAYLDLQGYISAHDYTIVRSTTRFSYPRDEDMRDLCRIVANDEKSYDRAFFELRRARINAIIELVAYYLDNRDKEENKGKYFNVNTGKFTKRGIKLRHRILRICSKNLALLRAFCSVVVKESLELFHSKCREISISCKKQGYYIVEEDRWVEEDIPEYHHDTYPIASGDKRTIDKLGKLLDEESRSTLVDIHAPLTLTNKKLREYIFGYYNGNRDEAPCYCCGNLIRRYTKDGKGIWHVGHVRANKHGGVMCVDNLRPICASCNLSMGSTDMRVYCLMNNMNGRLRDELESAKGSWAHSIASLCRKVEEHILKLQELDTSHYKRSERLFTHIKGLLREEEYEKAREECEGILSIRIG